MKTKKPSDVREEVSRAYAGKAAAATGCCGGNREGASFAGYRQEELDTLPESAATSSFGCGDPLAMSGVKEGEVVLDLGSGTGLDLILAARKVGETGRVIGVDMTDEMIGKARENVAAAGHTNVEVRRGIIEDLPVEDASVDWVISNCVINLSPEKPRVFKEIARVLKPGGRMLVSDIVAEDLPEWITGSLAMYSSCVAGAISEKKYLAGLEAAGLTDVEVRDRLVYDAPQLLALAKDDLPSATDDGCGCGCVLETEFAEKAATELEGKIWSAKVYAQKP